MSARLEVLTRQLTASHVAMQQCSDAASVDFDPSLMYRALVHDNIEMRQAIYDFLCKVPVIFRPLISGLIH